MNYIIQNKSRSSEGWAELSQSLWQSAVLLGALLTAALSALRLG